MTSFYIGTAGWSYEDWKGVVYPEKKEAGFHPLAFLAQYINIVEVNSTFYRPPSISMSLFWIKHVGEFPEFLFAVKIHQAFTHDRKNFGQKDVDEFKLGIEPLRVKNRLACLLFQFPWSFVNSASNFDYLGHLFNLFEGYPMTVEVRHSSWNKPGFYDFLSERRVSYCNIDQPVLRSSIKPSAISTTPEFAYVRLHGRNYKDWFREGAGRDARYDYLYSNEELEEWVERIKALSQKSGKVFVITNNHYRGQALANALQIKNMLTGEKLTIPGLLLKRYPVLEEIAKKLAKGQLNLFNERK
jgi:uncharacterized protein YecE (DUF72 family)